MATVQRVGRYLGKRFPVSRESPVLASGIIVMGKECKRVTGDFFIFLPEKSW